MLKRLITSNVIALVQYRKRNKKGDYYKKRYSKIVKIMH